jgi:apolipoprotein N-acyltransferase
LVFAAWVLALQPLLGCARPLWWVVAGASSFAAWWGVLVAALLGWTAFVQVTFVFAAVLCGATVFGLTGLISGPRGQLPTSITLPAAWVVTVLGLEHAGLGSISFAAAIVPETPALGVLARTIGGLGIEASLLACAALVARSRRGALIGAVIGSALLLALRFVDAPQGVTDKTLHVMALQPATQTSTSASVGLSFMARRQLERNLDSLTRDALNANPEALVVWPEGGNRLPNAQLEDRRRRLRALAPHGEVLVAGRSIDPEGRAYSALQLFVDGVFVAETRKTAVVPFAEAYLASGSPVVINTRQGRVGAQVCFDSLRTEHALALREAGAEMLLVSSDDESFGHTPLAYWHQSISVLRAVEAGLPIAFVSNAGPSTAFDAQGRRVPGGADLGERTIVQLAIPLEQRRVFAWKGPLSVAAIATVLLGLLAVARHPRALKMPPGVCAASGFGSVGIASALAVGALSTFLVQVFIGDDPRVVVSDWRRRWSPPPLIDELSSLYRQSEQMRCGAAAIAYVLTLLGDEVFESDVAAALGDAPPEGYSFADLEAFAHSRGFLALGFAADFSQLRAESGTTPIVHLRHGHFVVVMDSAGTDILVFDPAVGKRIAMPRSALENAWSGHYLRVVPGPSTTSTQIGTSRLIR